MYRNPKYGRYGQCLATTLKGEQCENPSSGPHMRCFVPKHKAEALIGRGIQSPLPSPVGEAGGAMDMEMPLDPAARKAHIRNKLNPNTH